MRVDSQKIVAMLKIIRDSAPLNRTYKDSIADAVNLIIELEKERGHA